MTTVMEIGPEWQTYFMAVLHRFSKEAWEDVFRQLRASPGCESTRCSYDVEDDVFEITCIADQGQRNLAALDNLVQGYIVQEQNRAEISNHGPKIFPITAALVHKEAFEYEAVSVKNALEISKLQSGLEQRNQQQSDQSSHPLCWTPKGDTANLATIASPENLKFLESFSGCKLVLDGLSRAIVIIGDNDQHVGELLDRLDVIETEQLSPAAGHHAFRLTSLASLTDGSLGRVLIPTDWCSSENELNVKILTNAMVIRLFVYDVTRQKYVEDKRSVRAPQLADHLRSKDVWSGFRFCELGERPPPIVVPDPPPVSSLSASDSETEEFKDAPIQQWMQAVEPSTPPSINRQESESPNKASPKNHALSWENYAPKRPDFSWASPNPLVGRFSNLQSMTPGQQSQVSKNYSPTKSFRGIQPRGRNSVPSRTFPSQTRGNSQRNDTSRETSANQRRGQQRARQLRTRPNGRHRGSGRGTSTHTTTNRFELIDLAESSDDDYQDSTGVQEFPPGYTPPASEQPSNENSSSLLVSFPKVDTQSASPVSYPALAGLPAQRTNDSSRKQSPGQTSQSHTESLQFSSNSPQLESRANGITKNQKPSIARVDYPLMPIYDNGEELSDTYTINNEKKEELETRVRFSSGKKRAPAPAPSSKAKGKDSTTQISKALENLKLDFDSSQTILKGPARTDGFPLATAGVSTIPHDNKNFERKSTTTDSKDKIKQTPSSGGDALLDCLRRTLEAARSFRGRIKIEFQIGQILIQDSKRHFQRDGSALNWSQVKEGLMSIGGFEKEPGNFTKAVTTCTFETVALLDLLGIAQQEPYSRCAVWEFICKSADKREVRVVVDAISPVAEPKVILNEQMLGVVYIHAASSVHDARLTITGTSYSKDIAAIPGVNDILKSLFVEPAHDQNEELIDISDNPALDQGAILPTLTARDGELFVEAVRLRSALRIQLPLRRYNARDHYIEIIRIQDLPIDRANLSVAENAGVFRARGVSEQDLIAAQRLWYEVNLGEVEPAPEFIENEHLELGQRATWCCSDVVDETSVAALQELTAKLVEKMDCIGFGNKGPGLEEEKRIQAAKAGSLLKDEFW